MTKARSEHRGFAIERFDWCFGSATASGVDLSQWSIIPWRQASEGIKTSRSLRRILKRRHLAAFGNIHGRILDVWGEQPEFTSRRPSISRTRGCSETQRPLSYGLDNSEASNRRNLFEFHVADRREECVVAVSTSRCWNAQHPHPPHARRSSQPCCQPRVALESQTRRVSSQTSCPGQ